MARWPGTLSRLPRKSQNRRNFLQPRYCWILRCSVIHCFSYIQAIGTVVADLPLVNSEREQKPRAWIVVGVDPGETLPIQGMQGRQRPIMAAGSLAGDPTRFRDVHGPWRRVPNGSGKPRPLTGP